MENSNSRTPLPHKKEIECEIGGLIISGFEGKILKGDLKKALRDGLGGVILFPRNLGNPKNVLKLNESLMNEAGEGGLIISIDHEGGRVMRLGKPFTHFPPFAAIGRTGDVELAREVGQATGRELAAVGINLNYSPVVDLAEPDTETVIGDRSFGTDPGLVFKLASAYVDGMQSEGVAACAKHFPGHGAVVGDSHKELPEIDLTLEQMEPHLEPFRRMAESDVACVMSAHVRIRGIDHYYPATISSSALKGMLREQMGYKGVIITDDMQMAAIADMIGVADGAFTALRAGADMVMVANDLQLAIEVRKHLNMAVRHMAIPFDDICDSFDRVKALKSAFPASSKKRPSLDVIGCSEHRDLADRLAEYA